MVVGYMNGFGTEVIAFVGAGYIHDAVADAEGELAAVVHQGCDGEVGKGEQGSSLTYVASIEMIGCYCHFSNGMVLVRLGYLTSCAGGEAVGLVQ